MRAVFYLLAAFGLFAATPSLAAPFAVPLLDSELSDIRGGAVSHDQRLLSDANAMAAFRQTSDINRMTFDNWFANEGTILIVNNLLR